MHRQVSLDFRDDERPPDLRRTLAWRGMSAEYVSLGGERQFDYRLIGSDHYLALHDLKKIDGETSAADGAPVRLLDVRDRMTYLPRGCGISGWSHLAPRRNSFMALYYTPTMMMEELDVSWPPNDDRPMLYFEDSGLRSTLGKIQALLQEPSPASAVYAETLGMLAAIEISRMQNGGRDLHVHQAGRLSPGQERLVREYISENLHREISLSDLAGLVQLSRFHFARTFKKTIGLPPHQFLLQSRIERAKLMLLRENISVVEISERLGFANQVRFCEAFRKVTGSTPSYFRRAQIS